MGNPLIKEEMELQTQIKDLKMEKSRYNEKIYDLQDSIKVKIPSEIQYLEASIKHNKTDFETAINQPKVMNDEGKESYPIKIKGKVYNDRASGGEALKAVIGANMGSLAEGKTVAVGEYRGLKLSIMYDTLSKGVKACLKGEKHHYCDLNTQTTGGNLIRFDNCINNIEKNIKDMQEKVNTFKNELEQMKADVQKPFPKSNELFKAETRLEEVHEALTKFELTDDALNKEIFERLADNFPEIISGKCDTMKYEAGECFDTLYVEMRGTELSLAHTYTQNGYLMYDPRIDFEVDYENERVIPISYENSGLGIYESYDTEADPTPESARKMNSVLDFTDNWLDNIEEQGYSAVEVEEKEKDYSFER